MAFCAGLVVGGALTATGLVVVGSLIRAPLPDAVRWSIVAAALVPVLLRDFGVLSFALPENRRLVPESVFRLGPHLGPLQFGIEMGTAMRTYLPSGLPYIGGLVVLLFAPLPLGLCAGVGFGLGRALMTTSNVRYRGDWDAEWARHARTLAALMTAAFVLGLLILS
ncbi:hypothetical protein NLX83_25155 [Allokutzneria sp. A3M-2-11 16]|uniref:hypothetical protein n=1 Tax=Allokutzneria sp. A3M-2-11 16 TaxID=2962043 RepID=UPI0020B78A6C|nr:hypothetical protein [Allokutzneria sp. A3M-2-11 16]MCP3802564.1 hypothetical protein [Allokutzneria sp. A3M-2-11 16]